MKEIFVSKVAWKLVTVEAWPSWVLKERWTIIQICFRIPFTRARCSGHPITTHLLQQDQKMMPFCIIAAVNPANTRAPVPPKASAFCSIYPPSPSTLLALTLWISGRGYMSGHVVGYFVLERYRLVEDSHSNHGEFAVLWWGHSFLCGL